MNYNCMEFAACVDLSTNEDPITECQCQMGRMMNDVEDEVKNFNIQQKWQCQIAKKSLGFCSSVHCSSGNDTDTQAHPHTTDKHKDNHQHCLQDGVYRAHHLCRSHALSIRFLKDL